MVTTDNHLGDSWQLDTVLHRDQLAWSATLTAVGYSQQALNAEINKQL